MAETKKGGQTSSPLITDRGRTTVTDAVVSGIVGVVVQEVSGAEPSVGGRGASLPGDTSPTVGEFLGNLTGSARGTRGISVDVGETQTAIDLTVTVPYGRSIPEITQTMRDRVVRRVENLTGLEVTEVTITVRDVFIPQQ